MRHIPVRKELLYFIRTALQPTISITFMVPPNIIIHLLALVVNTDFHMLILYRVTIAVQKKFLKVTLLKLFAEFYFCLN